MTTSYLIQSHYAPLWLYGVGLGGIGIAPTRHMAQEAAKMVGAGGGRGIPGHPLFYHRNLIEARAWTGALGYIVLIWASLTEIGFVDEG